MLSYRHAYHAGNYADVLKHVLLSRILIYLTQKPKPLYYLETHAGRGLYNLKGFEASKTGESARGIALLHDAVTPDELQPYLSCVRSVCHAGKLNAYPGSPWLAKTLLRPADRLHLCELHPRDFIALEANFAHIPEVKCFEEDGYTKGLALLPPQEKRPLLRG